MNDTLDAAAAANGGTLEARQAARILDQTTQQARRQLEPFPPWFSAVRGVAALAAYGAVWLAVRGQHPYTGPTWVAIPAGIGFGVVTLTAAALISRRATAGVSGKSRLRPAEIAIMTVIWVGVFAILGVLAGAGVSHEIVYGVYPATVPLMAAGLGWAGIMVRRTNWPAVVTALAIAVVGAVAVFAGAAGSWAVAGAGICVVLLSRAAIIAWRQRA
jgi:hypothetical protein